jgi:hypothetical protein
MGIEGVERRMQQTSLSDEELVSRIAALCLEGRRLVARLIVHLMEVEDRALDKKSACSSMWEFCTERLKMSDGEASRRLNAARLVRRFPSVLGRIERGETHLSALRQLRPYLEEANVDAVLDEAKGKTRSQLDEMIARRFPRPNAPTIEIPIAASMTTTATAGATTATAPALACPARIEPLSATGVLVQMTMTAEAYADLKPAKELLGHCIPDGDTVKVIERALRTLVEDLERDRRAKTSRPQASVRPSKSGHIAAATRREVFARDGERCSSGAPTWTPRGGAASAARASSSTTSSPARAVAAMRRRTFALGADRTTCTRPRRSSARSTSRRGSTVASNSGRNAAKTDHR